MHVAAKPIFRKQWLLLLVCLLSIEERDCSLAVFNQKICKQLGPVHTYPDIFESATFSFWIRLPSTRIRRIRQGIRKKKINPLSRVEKNKSATNPITCGRVNPDIFESDDVKSVSSLSPNNKPTWRNNVSGEQNQFPATISLYGACSNDILVQRSLGY